MESQALYDSGSEGNSKNEDEPILKFGFGRYEYLFRQFMLFYCCFFYLEKKHTTNDISWFIGNKLLQINFK